MEEKEKIRRELTQVLEKDPNNYSKILELSTLLASKDENNVRFSVDAGVIDRLGQELVARQETAVSELIKNSYDADAKVVKATFQNSQKVGGSLTIDDNGTGMTREELISGFMRISSTEKYHRPVSNIYKRKRAGRKGIGRFAVQRLGKQLSIITQTKEEKQAIKINIDWDKYSRDADLFSIANKIEYIPKQKPQGTTLIIEDLRDEWSEAAIKRIYRYVSAILQPFPLSKEAKTQERKRISKTRDPGFKASFLERHENSVKTIADESSMIFKYALAIIEGYVNPYGFGFFSVASNRLKINQKGKIGKTKNDDNEKFAHLKNVHFKAHYFVYDRDYIPGQQRTNLQALAKEMGGIRLYRNGFRVLPYGEPFTDWLGLDESIRKRGFLPVHSNNNFFGFVEVTERAGLLEETSSREGLQQNAAFDELRDFIFRCIIAGVTATARERGVKVTTSQKNWTKKYDKPNTKLRAIVQNVSTEIEKIQKRIEKPSKNKKGEAKGRGIVVSKFKSFVRELNNVIKQQESIQAEILDELAMLRILSSLGLTIGEFTHEIRHYINITHANLKLLVKSIEDNSKHKQKLEDLYSNVDRLQVYTSYFDKTLSENVVRNLIPIEITDSVNSFTKVILADAERRHIEILEPDIKGFDLYTTPMHSSEWASILFNLYTNSKKAIKRAESNGKIFIKAGRDNGKIYLEFSDNGDGIPKKNQDKIFDAFFTTSRPAGHSSNEGDEILGTGLGLKIVSDIVSAYNGTIEVVDPPKGFKTCLRIEIPEASKNEIKDI